MFLDEAPNFVPRRVFSFCFACLRFVFSIDAFLRACSLTNAADILSCRCCEPGRLAAAVLTGNPDYSVPAAAVFALSAAETQKLMQQVPRRWEPVHHGGRFALLFGCY